MDVLERLIRRRAARPRRRPRRALNVAAGAALLLLLALWVGVAWRLSHPSGSLLP